MRREMRLGSGRSERERLRRGVVCGHRLGTRRRETLDCLSETITKVYAAAAPSGAARKLQCSANALCRERILARDFIGRIANLSARPRSHAAGRFWPATRCALRLSSRILEFVHDGCDVRANRIGFGGQVPLDQPARQQGTAALVHPCIEQLADLLSHVGGKIQSRLFKRLQSRLRRTQKKLPIHFLLGTLAHGDPPNGCSTLPFY